MTTTTITVVIITIIITIVLITTVNSNSLGEIEHRQNILQLVLKSNLK